MRYIFIFIMALMSTTAALAADTAAVPYPQNYRD